MDGERMRGKNVPFSVVKSRTVRDAPPVEPESFQQCVWREFIGLSATAGEMAGGLLASPVQLSALVAGLKVGESIIARYCTSRFGRRQIVGPVDRSRRARQQQARRRRAQGPARGTAGCSPHFSFAVRRRSPAAAP